MTALGQRALWACSKRTLAHTDTAAPRAQWAHGSAQLASGGNDNAVAVWLRGAGAGAAPLWRLRAHTAAVKALAWSPHQAGLLASGGGTSDRHIRRACGHA